MPPLCDTHWCPCRGAVKPPDTPFRTCGIIAEPILLLRSCARRTSQITVRLQSSTAETPQTMANTRLADASPGSPES
eukprot:scaffold7431_cov185-Isochrysis_galbana.AAC.2